MNNISVILVKPAGSMNIGMAARAMKNCGIINLKLVSPIYFKQKEAHMMAVGAKDVVDSSIHYRTLAEALADETCSFAFSRRMAKDREPYYSLDEAGPVMTKRALKGKLALVFGNEADGLTKDELYRCDFRVYIPTSETFGSLNLAQAVLLACFEIFRKTQAPRTRSEDFFAPNSEIKPMLDSLSRLLSEIGYNTKHEGKLRKKIRQAFAEIVGRAGLRHKDVNMFLGIFSQVRKTAGIKD